ncbi:hypothetical protein DDB_G0271408 [Dictyostelium discoideum AX4]|uniref:Uncharacterized protein n=1 Tax=Dictyostelium discoideum TaxID=44689 RepID=Q55B86_DICDI|nr:hypothetical protein DDB_G0271408 [Dictyostelium discoideum AX4]EAL71834.1 hypothetical protein DDB_G0271408 [Dictyostelium discoideum AX4]|eukprot:XP_645726.1 hypothetical protein DDB_G0271408 [Dictyostelium discoideum AX4]
MSTNKKIKTDNNNKKLQDIIDFEILKSIINYLLINKKNNNNNNNTSNQYKINKFYFNINEILNYILVSKKWYNFISLTISNNIINNKSFEHCLKINYNNNNKSFIENYNNQNQYDKNYLIFKNKDNNQYKISFNKEFTIIKIKESIIEDYFKFNLFLHKFEFEDFKEIKNKFENNQLLYNRIVVNVDTDYMCEDDTLLRIQKYISNENPEIISNLFKILELNFGFWLENGYRPDSEEDEEEGEDDDDDTDDKGNKKCTTELYLNNISIDGFCIDDGEDNETVKIFKILKGRNLIYRGSDVESDSPTHVNYSALFDPDNSGQQVESIKVKNESDNEEFVEARHLIKVHQFENLHSITIPINSFQILSNLSEEMGFYSLYRNNADSGNSENMKSELNQMINSLITCKSLKNLNLSCAKYISFSFDDFSRFDQIFANQINETIESYSNSFKPLFSELNTSIERIEFDCMGLLNINTFSNLLNNKSIKYLYLYGNSDFIVYSSKQTGDNGGGGDDDINELHKELISTNQYLFDNIFSSPLTSIRHYKIKFIESKQIKFIFNLILNNIFKLQLYSLIFEFNENEIVGEFVKEYKDLINNISTQQKQEQKSNNINLKEIKIKIKDDKYIQELNNINNPYFSTVIKKMA